MPEACACSSADAPTAAVWLLTVGVAAYLLGIVLLMVATRHVPSAIYIVPKLIGAAVIGAPPYSAFDPPVWIVKASVS